MNVSFIGAGNVASHLAPAFDNTDFPVKEVWSRNIKHAEALVANLYHATAKASLDFSFSTSKIFIIAASDDAIPEIVQELVLPENAILVHTSGSQPLSVLGYAPTQNIGVLYPLQTFTKGKKIDLREVPFLIESESSETEKILTTMAKAITKKVVRTNSSQRKALHVAAVFASNFTNHMFTLAKEIVTEHKMDFELLKPLIVETINKSLAIGPEKAQTGPAKRGDLEILDNHFEFLQGDEAVAEIYKIISQNILDRYDIN
jgi:predicted short-subunit dehydrogenase-like oxidoreductase (DUF2520 family)